MTILVLDQPVTKINFLVPSLWVFPVGMLKEVMMTMATSTAIPTPPHRSFNQMTIDTSSSTLQKSTAMKSSIHYTNIASCSSPNILCNIPTRILQPSAANNVVNPRVNDNEQHPNQTECNDSALYYTFMQEWDAFYTEFITSQIHTITHSSAATLLSSPVIDDDN